MAQPSKTPTTRRKISRLTMADEPNCKILALPLLPIRNIVVLPKNIVPVRVSREFSIQAVKEAQLNFNDEIFITTQSNSADQFITAQDIFKIGVIARIIQATVEPDGSYKVLLEGLRRAEWVDILAFQPFISANVKERQPLRPSVTTEAALLRNLQNYFKDFVSQNSGISADIFKLVQQITNLQDLVDTITLNINLHIEERQDILEEPSLEKQAINICTFLKNEIEILKTEKSIKKRVQTQVEKHQKDYYLNEQVRAIYKEMGKEDILVEADNYRQQAKKLKLSPEAMEKVVVECRRLEQMQPTSPEATISRTYIEWLLAVPWNGKTKDSVNMKEAEKILNANHAGMQKIKDRILEFIATKKFAGEKLSSAPIICLLGPPGVGKTSLAKSIADALGREFVRISLGGIKDEAEIRGHRRTYIGSMPGKIIHAMRKAKVVNPLILLDEIDKMSLDFRGDPASALLEVLDPEQNNAFVDHFMEVGYDLTKAIFIATANVHENIPYPLLDRMEIISLQGYTEAEKISIALDFLIPRTMESHGLKNEQFSITQAALKRIICDYTREAGVRDLQRKLSSLMRKGICKFLKKERSSIVVEAGDLESWLGVAKHKQPVNKEKSSLGVTTGLAWTELGGEILEVEAIKLKGKGGLTITGQLGEVMQESAQASLTFIRAKTKELGLKEDFYSRSDIHIHLPEGAIPKDGPSAGITMATALTSVLTGIEIDRTIAMSGEITLQGRVLAVGGLKEKILAAVRFGIKKVILPKENQEEVLEFANELGNAIELIFVSSMEEVLINALVKNPFQHNNSAKKPEKKAKAKKTTNKKTETKK